MNATFPPVFLVQAAALPIMTITVMIRIADIKFMFSVFMGDLPSLARECYVHDLFFACHTKINTLRALPVPMY